MRYLEQGVIYKNLFRFPVLKITKRMGLSFRFLTLVVIF